MHFYRQKVLPEWRHLKMPLFQKYVFLRKKNPPAPSRHASGLGPKARQDKENPGQASLPGIIIGGRSLWKGGNKREADKKYNICLRQNQLDSERIVVYSITLETFV